MRHALSIALTAFLFATLSIAQAGDYDEGIEYQTVNPPMRAQADNGRIEVVEVFWYGCPHCYNLEPAMDEWLKNKPENVDFIRLPSPLNPSWAVHTRAFYAAQALGVEEQIHEPLFKAIQTDRRNLFSDQTMADFFEEHGVSRDDYLKTARSFGVAMKVRRARQLGKHWGIHGVPAFIVNGKYTTDVGGAGGEKQMFEVIDQLVAQESK